MSTNKRCRKGLNFEFDSTLDPAPNTPLTDNVQRHTTYKAAPTHAGIVMSRSTSTVTLPVIPVVQAEEEQHYGGIESDDMAPMADDDTADFPWDWMDASFVLEEDIDKSQNKTRTGPTISYSECRAQTPRTLQSEEDFFCLDGQGLTENVLKGVLEGQTVG
ncbi:hypothetical protein DXG01_010060 [Tephrocybe rancida]|nr:hypothetical protein DXG01_010060 [Tephrocybe rancida]